MFLLVACLDSYVDLPSGWRSFVIVLLLPVYALRFAVHARRSGAILACDPDQQTVIHLGLQRLQYVGNFRAHFIVRDLATPGQEGTYSLLTMDTAGATFRNERIEGLSAKVGVCLPDTMDPRGSKAGAR